MGIDIGSRTIKTAAFKDGILIDYQVAESGFDPHHQSLEMIRKYKPRRIVATGYGRHLAQKHFAGMSLPRSRRMPWGPVIFSRIAGQSWMWAVRIPRSFRSMKAARS